MPPFIPNRSSKPIHEGTHLQDANSGMGKLAANLSQEKKCTCIPIDNLMQMLTVWKWPNSEWGLT